MAGRKAQDAVVFIFDRRCDPVTPLLNQWTYQGNTLIISHSGGKFLIFVAGSSWVVHLKKDVLRDPLLCQWAFSYLLFLV